MSPRRELILRDTITGFYSDKRKSGDLVFARKEINSNFVSIRDSQHSVGYLSVPVHNFTRDYMGTNYDTIPDGFAEYRIYINGHLKGIFTNFYIARQCWETLQEAWFVCHNKGDSAVVRFECPDWGNIEQKRLSITKDNVKNTVILIGNE